jgi:hypothetical protein
MGKVADRRNRLLAVLAENPSGVLMEQLLQEAGGRADRAKLVSAVRHLAATGRIHIERTRRSHGHRPATLEPPRVRPAVTDNGRAVS